MSIESGTNDQWATGAGVRFGGPDEEFGTADQPQDQPVRPVAWDQLTADEALVEWIDLDRWVTMIKNRYGLPPAVVPPYWHRHEELVWELSALHLSHLAAYEPDASAHAPLAWHRDFAEARHRLRDWVSTCGTRLDSDRPTRTTLWPGETPTTPPAVKLNLVDRHADFHAWIHADIDTRRRRDPYEMPPGL